MANRDNLREQQALSGTLFELAPRVARDCFKSDSDEAPGFQGVAAM
jgi:hypothetical protein